MEESIEDRLSRHPMLTRQRFELSSSEFEVLSAPAIDVPTLMLSLGRENDTT
jgi:hypothetical protein